MSSRLCIDFHFDLICPWCLIGKRQLEWALARLLGERPELVVELRWHSQQLLPDLPPAGLPYQEFYEARLGGPQRVAARRGQVQAAARRAGLEIAFERIRTMPNTLLAHRLIDCVRHRGTAVEVERLIERLFVAYFMEGGDIGNIDHLLAQAAAVGLAPALIDDFLATVRDGAQADGAVLSTATVSGVPFFVFDGHLALSGAQPPEILLTAMCEALAMPAAA